MVRRRLITYLSVSYLLGVLRSPILALPIVLLHGCTNWHGFNKHDRHTHGVVNLQQAQACAIGYDLAREVHRRISLKRTVLLAPQNPSPCEYHALDYLRRAGFQIDEARKSSLGGTGFNVTLARMDAETITATGSIGGTLKISRSYRPVISGVIATSPPAILNLDPDTYTPKPDAHKPDAHKPDAHKPDAPKEGEAS